MSALRKNVASQVLTFGLVNATTGAALPGATVTTKVSLDGTQSAGAGTVTDQGSGQYKYVPTQGETNGTTAGFLFTATNAVPVNLHCFITAGDPTDAVRQGMTALPNAAAEAAGGLYTRGSGAGQLSQAANGKLGGVTLVDTLTTYTGDTPQTGDSFARIGAAGVSLTAVSLSSAGTQAIWDKLTSALTTVGSAGKLLVDNLNATVSSRLASASYTAPLDAAATRAALGMASANLDTQLSTIDDFLDTEIAAILAAVDTEVASALAAALAILALLDDPRGEPGQIAPPVNPDMATKVDFLYKSWRNKKTNDGTTTKLYADDTTTVDQKQSTSEAAGTVTKGEWAVGP